MITVMHASSIPRPLGVVGSLAGELDLRRLLVWLILADATLSIGFGFDFLGMMNLLTMAVPPRQQNLSIVRGCSW
jgi:hypothetical protein